MQFKKVTLASLGNGIERQKQRKGDQETIRILQRDGSGICARMVAHSRNGEKRPDLGIY